MTEAIRAKPAVLAGSADAARRARLRAWLPSGAALPEAVWQQRHRGILVVLWLHIPAVLAFALYQGAGLAHGLFEIALIASMATLATWSSAARRVSTVAASIGLLTCSAALVHLSGGVIEMHFHYFVMVGVITLYQDWYPFLVAIAYVVLQHGAAGVMSPESVYNHQSAISHPWAWASIHGGFILAMSASGIVTWRLNESLLEHASDRQKRLSEAQEVAHLGSWELDLASGELTWSDEMHRLYDIDEGGLWADSIESRVHPQDRESVAAAVRETIELGVPHLVEYRVLHRDGRVRWLQGRGERISAPDGTVLSLAGTAQDITDQRQSIDALRDSEERFRTLTETASDAIVSADADGVITSFNHQAELLFSLGASEAIGQPLALLIPDRFHADHHERLARLAGGGVHVPDRRTVEIVARRCGGEEFPVEVSLGTWRTGDDLNFTAIMRDISERRAAEAASRTTLSLLSATLDSTADGILVVDRHGKITSFNRQFVDMWRIPDEVVATRDDSAALGFVLEQVVDPAGFAAKVQELYQQPNAESYDTIQFRDGRVFERSSRPQRVEGDVVGRVWSFRDVTERKRLEDDLAHQAFHDSLTNLANQALFRDRVDHAVTRVRQSGGRLAVLFIDLDNFKKINDSLGHTAGDSLLVAVTQRLLSALGPADTAARLGGDEFAVLIEDLESEEQAVSVGESILAALARPFTVAATDVVVTASVGVACDAEGTPADQLLRNADLAMYTAKNNGKARVESFRAAMHATAVERLELEADLRHAVARGELVLYYQPIINLATGDVIGAEALVRWQHPVRGLVAPMSFIPLAEETGLIGEIGGWILSEACRQMGSWIDPGEQNSMLLSVNLSTRQLLSPTITDAVAAALAASRLDPSRLVLEITETSMMEDTAIAIANLEQLKALGVQLAVDDFGTGYSSLSYLQRFPIDILKIDKSFVDRITAGPEEGSLARAIVRLAQTMQLTTIAEGVEDVAQSDELRRVGCDLAQGFHFARPLPATAFGVVLADRRRASSGSPVPAEVESP